MPDGATISDGCTLWPDGSWLHCCQAHDLAYAIGADRIAADIDLARCVAATGNGAMAILMLAGVVAFGWIFHRRKR